MVPVGPEEGGIMPARIENMIGWGKKKFGQIELDKQV